jgi:hypothetical protein
MSSKVITVRHRPDGVLTNFDSAPVFEDPTATYGLRRTDTAAVITPPTVSVTAMTNSSTGVYTYTFEDLLPSIPYEYWLKTTYLTSVIRINRTFTGGADVASSAESPFFTTQQFLDRWGEKNVRIASNKDNTSAVINYDALQGSFDYATSEIYQAFRGGLYAIPLDFTPNDNIVPATVQRWAMIIAYADLYDARGQDERDRAWNKISTQLKAVYADMGMCRVGLKELPAELSHDTPLETAQVSAVEVFEAAPDYWWTRYPDSVPTWR